MIASMLQNKLAIIGIVVVLAGSVWYVLSSGSAPQEGLVTESFVSPASEAERDLVATLLALRAVKLEGSVFSNPVFQSLKDFGSTIVPEPVGRENPFAPLPTASSTGTLRR